MRQCYVTLDGITFPVHPDNPQGPLVAFGGLVKGQANRELVVIQGVPENPPQIDVATLGQLRYDELFILRIFVATMLPGRNRVDKTGLTGMDVFNRLEELSDAVQWAFRDPDDGQPIGGFSRMEADGDCGAVTWRVVTPNPQIAMTDEGIQGTADIDVIFTTRL